MNQDSNLADIGPAAPASLPTTTALATFRVDVTPPVGHPLCGGWLRPAVGIADPLYATGFILTGSGAPVVLLAIDWCEISNRTYHMWQKALADAAGTEPSRVSVHCIHAHCTPWPDNVAQGLVNQHSGLSGSMDATFCDETIARVAEAARAAAGTGIPVTHISTGRGRVEKVASNRRIMGEDGKVKAVRWTTTHDAEVRAEPEGQIDPWLKTITFYNEDEKLAVLHYYAVHPSSYEDRWVSPDFSGLAREQRIRENGGVPHLFFTECAGDITAGKYNDGARELRQIFTERLHAAMLQSEAAPDRRSLTQWHWRSVPVRFAPREDHSQEMLQSILADSEAGTQARNRAAIALAYHERIDLPIEIGALYFNDDICVLHLPGESFIEYQHFAQQLRPDSFVAVPSYGDCGPGYICLERSYAEGGYEPTDSFIAPASEAIMRTAIIELLKPDV